MLKTKIVVVAVLIATNVLNICVNAEPDPRRRVVFKPKDDAGSYEIEYGCAWNEIHYVAAPISVSDDRVVYFASGNVVMSKVLYMIADHQWDATAQLTDLAYDAKNISSVTELGSYLGSANTTSTDLLSYVEAEAAVKIFPGYRMLTGEEWTYLLKRKRGDEKLNKVGKLQCSVYDEQNVDVYGLFIFPDNYLGSLSVADLKEEDWYEMESKGVVFLPMTIANSDSDGEYGLYWGLNAAVMAEYRDLETTMVVYSDSPLNANGRTLALRLVADNVGGELPVMNEDVTYTLDEGIEAYDLSGKKINYTKNLKPGVYLLKCKGITRKVVLR